jgi:hypothetical protein
MLMQYLADRRSKLNAALDALHMSSSQAASFPPLSSTPVAELFALPDAPLSALTPAQLVRFAQVVATALFKCYLQARPGLVGSLCRLDNWFEVTEVEEELTTREVSGYWYYSRQRG